MPVAIVTGASKGLGRALSTALASQGWSVVIDARREPELAEAASDIQAAAAGGARVIALAGDVTDPSHRQALVSAAGDLGGLDLLVNNASTLGPSPLLEVAEMPEDELRRIYEVNVLAPIALIRAALPLLERAGSPAVVNLTSDASVAHYETWGGYGSAKAALDHLSLTLGKERPGIRVLAVDPGDMRTEMHQAAFPGEDISDRPLAETVVGSFLALVEPGAAASGRHRAADFPPAVAGPSATEESR